MKNLSDSLDIYIDIKETAAALSVTSATIRNWMKSGRIRAAKKQGNTLLFNKKEIDALRGDIYSGKSHRLKSRRNKKAIIGQFIPTEYVSSELYIKVAEKLLTWINEKNLSMKLEPAPILYEVVLNLLAAKGQIQPIKNVFNKSLTEAVLEKQPILGHFEPPLNGLFVPDTSLSQDMIEILRKIRRLNIPFIKGEDLLGLLYMSLSSLNTRKNNGAYYTPKNVVELLVMHYLDELREDILPKTLDPCCGSGNFLIRLFSVLKERELNKGRVIKEVEKSLVASLHGYDIDPMATALAQLNIILLLETPFGELNDEHIPIQCQNALDTQESILNKAFDLVIGNPPWGYSYTPHETMSLKKRFVTAKRTVESYCLFIEYGINRLKPRGILAYVLPESLLNVQAHEPTRQFLVDETEIRHIDVLGHTFSKVYAPSILLTAKKSHSSADNEVIVHHEGEAYIVTQKRFSSNQGTIFNIKASDADEAICAHMRCLDGVQFLNCQADFALGIVTGDNRHFLHREPIFGGEPIIKGGNVFKYKFEIGEHYIVFKPKQFQQVAPEKWYRAPEKLIYRFINENLVFAYDDQGLLSLNSANIVIPRLPGNSIKYILAILNSRPAQFFHQVSFHSVKVLRRHIESIPIPPCSVVEERAIIHLVDQMLQEKDPTERLRLYEMIDTMVMSLYQFPQAYRNAIYKKTEQIKFL
jgi:excisionase family DNA binding protein